MAAISQQELALVGGTYLLVTSLYLWWLNRSAKALLRAIRRDEDSAVWETIGAPESMQQVVQDPHKRWRKFIRTGSYRRLCTPLTASKIDAFLRLLDVGGCVLGLSGAIILYRFWPLLKPALLGA